MHRCHSVQTQPVENVTNVPIATWHRIRSRRRHRLLRVRRLLAVRGRPYIGTPMPDNDASGLSAYELERLDNMRRNAEHLESLGLEARPPSVRRPAGSSSSRKRPARAEPLPPAEGVRRSSRQRTLTSIYSDETPLPEPRRATEARPWGEHRGSHVSAAHQGLDLQE